MTDLHEKTKKEIEKEGGMTDFTYKELWETAHRQRCEELEKLKKCISQECCCDEHYDDGYRDGKHEAEKENSELRKEIEAICDRLGFVDARVLIAEIRSLLKEVK